jgi:hypothetical protein
LNIESHLLDKLISKLMFFDDAIDIFATSRRIELTTWSRVLLEKLAGRHLVKKFPTFYGTRRFITAFMTAHHLSLS